jgi:hypothetical protein
MKLIISLCALVLTFNSCSRALPHRGGDSDDAGAAELVRYNLNLSVEGCSSGYTSQVTETSSSIVVYKFDQGCLAKLNSLVVDSVTYVPSSSDPFDTWQKNDTAQFEDAAGTGKRLSVQVLNQLDTPIPSTTPTHGVEYVFSTIDKGATKDCTGDCVRNNYTVAVNGVEAPSFDISTFAFVDMNQNGAGVFMFKFECSVDLVGVDANATCKGASLSGLNYKLIQDTFNSDLDITQASNIMSSDTISIDISEVIAAGSDSTMPHGGFVSKALIGPDKMHLNPNMIMLLGTRNTSYKFWNVDVTPIVQP